jgi:hypothetical protein
MQALVHELGADDQMIAGLPTALRQETLALLPEALAWVGLAPAGP